MALAANALTETGIVRDELGINDLSQDSRIDRLINFVSQEMEDDCGRIFGQGVGIVELQKGFGSTILILTRPPLTTITEVKIDDLVLDATSYSIDDPKAGFVRRSDGSIWPWTALRRGDITRDRLPGSEEKAIQVTYTGGWILPKDSLPEAPTRTLPHDIEGAVIDEIVSRFRQKGRDTRVTSEKALSESISWAKPEKGGKSYTPSFQRVINKYMRDRFGR